MIDLKVADYCQKCPHFEAQTDEIISPVSACFVITCANMEKCRTIYKYIKEREDMPKKYGAPLK